jgi:hypothetical protein
MNKNLWNKLDFKYTQGKNVCYIVTSDIHQICTYFVTVFSKNEVPP